MYKTSFVPVNVPLINGNEKKYLNECISSGWISSEGPFVKQFEEQFQQSGGQPVTRTASSGTTDVTDGTSPLTSIWNGISSAAAWAGAEKTTPAEQGTPAKGGLPKGSSWFVPSSETPTAQPAGYQTPTARPESSSFSSPPSNTTPQQFPIGAQSPLKTPGT